MNSIVKITYPDKKLKLATKKGYESIPLQILNSKNLELTEKRICTGYFKDQGEMQVCPDFKEIDSGSQCKKCFKKDYYSNYRQGKEETNIRGLFSVYLAQCGDKVKVGVTKKNRLRSRWLEQGANYAVELYSDLSSKKALEKEDQISSEYNITERISKKRKLNKSSIEKIEIIVEEIGIDTKIHEISKSPNINHVEGSGLLPKPIEGVKGQIIYNNRFGLALRSGKVLKKAGQQDLQKF